MVVVLWQNWGEHVGKQLPHFLAAATLTDVTISVGANSLRAHRIILAFFSPFFRRMLEEVSEERPMVVVFPGANFEALQTIIAYMYRGQVNVPADLLHPVIELAKMLKVKGLIELPAHLDSVIAGSGAKLDINQVDISDAVAMEDAQELCLEAGEGMVELEVRSADSHHTPHAPSPTTHPTHEPPDAGVALKAEVSGGSSGDMDDTPHSLLLQTPQLHLPTPDPTLTPTHIVKLSEDGTMGEVLFGGEYLNTSTSTTTTASTPSTSTTTTTAVSTTTTTAITTSTPVVDAQDGQGTEACKKKRKIVYKLTRYGPDDLHSALEEVRLGHSTLREIAGRWGVPHSTLSVNARLAGISVPSHHHSAHARSGNDEGGGLPSYHDPHTLEMAKQAVRAGSSYMKVSQAYNIPKSVLWRRCRQDGGTVEARGVPGCKNSARNYTIYDLTRAKHMLLHGTPLSQVAKETKIPKTTVFRVKEQLVREGRIPRSSITRLPRSPRLDETTLRMAVDACRQGHMSQGQASEKYQVPKTTLWRRLKHLKQDDGDDDDEEEEEEGGGDVGVEEADTSSTPPTHTPADAPTEVKVETIQVRYAEDDTGEVEEGMMEGSVDMEEVSDPALHQDPSKCTVGEEEEEDVGGQGEASPTPTPTPTRFELEMPLVNFSAGGYQVVGSEIVIGGQQVVVLEPPQPPPHSPSHATTTPSDPSTTTHHHHLVVAAFEQMEGLEDVDQTPAPPSLEDSSKDLP